MAYGDHETQTPYGGASVGPGVLKSVTPADGSDLPNGIARAIWVNGTAGNVVFTQPGESSSVTIALNAGTLYPFVVKRILSTSTTATGIFVLY